MDHKETLGDNQHHRYSQNIEDNESDAIKHLKQIMDQAQCEGWL